MRRLMASVLPALVLTVVTVSPASAGNGGLGPFDFSAPGGVISDGGVEFFPLTFGEMNLEIQDLQLDIFGLSHPTPADLNIFLVDPFGQSLQVMNGRGDQVPADMVDLTFNDLAVNELPTAPGVPLMSGLFLTEEAPNAFERFDLGGTDAWLLVIIDGVPEGGTNGSGFGGSPDGEFDSYRLSGTIVPEPATLALLGVGAIAMIRRKR